MLARIRSIQTKMKKKSTLWLSLLVTFVVLGLVAASGPGANLVAQAQHTFRTERFLSNEAGHLVYNRQTWGFAPERSSLKKLTASPLTAKSTGSQFEITLNGKSYRQSARVNDIIVSSKNQTVFFTKYESLPLTKSGPPLAYARLYKWTEKGGFENMNAPGVGTSSPRLSAHEQVLIEENYSTTSTPGADGTIMYDIASKTLTRLKNRALGSEAFVNASTTIFIERDRKSSDDAFGQLTKTDIATGNSEQLLTGQLAGRVTAFDGAMWVLMKNGNRYEVVRLSTDLKRIEETIAVK